VVRLRAPIEDVPLQFVPEGRVDHRYRLHLAALGEDRQALLGVVEVPELHPLKGAFADPDLQQQVKRDPVAALVLGEDRLLLILREGRPLHAAFLRRSDRPRRVAVQPSAECCPLEEPFQHADVLRPCAGGALALWGVANIGPNPRCYAESVPA
jgi:hypothetical protein